jgi:uncharacterized protein
MTPLNRIIFFTIVIGIILTIQFVVYRTFREFLLRQNIGKKTVNYLSRIPFIVFLLPFIFIFTSRANSEFIPEWLNKLIITPFFVFQGAVFFIGIFLVAGLIIKFPFRLFHFIAARFKSVKKKLDDVKSKKSVVKFDASRRKFLTGTTAMVSTYAFVGAGVGAVKKDDYEVEEVSLKIKNLPDELKGTRIVLISDIHAGPFMDTGLMNEYVTLINGMKPDLVFIPGDMTNSRKEEAAMFIKSFRDVRAGYGVFATLGNHDYFDNPQLVADSIAKETDIIMLRNDAKIIYINDKPLAVLGIEDTRDGGTGSNNILMQNVDTAVRETELNLFEKGLRNADVPRLLLAHKPYVFDYIQDRKFDVMLSGHTHGGQVVFFKLADINVSFASSISKYVNGLYKSGDKQLYVSRGIGTVGMPIRFNCPPEVTKITLE